MEQEQVVIKVYKEDRTKLKVLAARMGVSIPGAINSVLEEWERMKQQEYKQEYTNNYIDSRNQNDLEDLLEEAEPKMSPWVCAECGRDYRVDKSEPYCPHVKFTGNAYYLKDKLIRAASQAETLAYNEKARKEKYGN